MIDGGGRMLGDDRGKMRYASPIPWQTHGLAAEFGRQVHRAGAPHAPRALDGRDHDLLTFGDVLQRPYGAGKTGREPDGRGLAELIRTTTAPEKARLPWLKLARFGNARSEKGSLRNDRNVIAVCGIEADYDGEKIMFAEAVEILQNAGVEAIVYTSPSHTDAAPRWRILCVFSCELSPDRRQHMLGRLNGLFRGVLAEESWTLSQDLRFRRGYRRDRDRPARRAR